DIKTVSAADGNGDVSRKAFALPVDSGTACRTEMKGKRVAAFGGPHPRRSLTGEGDLLAAEARLVANHGPGATLALQAVTHGDARWFALERKVKLPAAAGGASGHGSAPWLSIWAECRLDFTYCVEHFTDVRRRLMWEMGRYFAYT